MCAHSCAADTYGIGAQGRDVRSRLFCSDGQHTPRLYSAQHDHVTMERISVPVTPTDGDANCLPGASRVARAIAFLNQALAQTQIKFLWQTGWPLYPQSRRREERRRQVRELLGGESDGDDGGGNGSGAQPSGGTGGGDQPDAAHPTGVNPAAAGGASVGERRSGKESKERRREK